MELNDKEKKDKGKQTFKIVPVKFSIEQFEVLTTKADALVKGNKSKLIRNNLFESGIIELKSKPNKLIVKDILLEDSKDPLEKIVPIRFTKGQIIYLNSIAEMSTGGDISKLIRLLIFKKKVEIVSKVDIETRNQLRKIGVNINQITRKVNSSSDKTSFQIELSNLNKFLKEVRDAINKIK